MSNGLKEYGERMYLYLFLNIFIFSLPFIFSFDKKASFWKKWRPFLGSFLIVGTAFILWDVYATEIGHWRFNENYLIGFKVLGLPIEEMMFFFTVPYACLFTYEVLKYYFREYKVPFRSWPYVAIGLCLFILGVAYWGQEYTSIVLIQAGVLSMVLPFIAPWILSSRIYWIFLLITLGLFLIFNMILTALPVVEYGPEHIWGGDGLWNGRFFTIPLEDFIYNATMMTYYLLAYLLIKKCIKRMKVKSSEE